MNCYTVFPFLFSFFFFFSFIIPIVIDNRGIVIEIIALPLETAVCNLQFFLLQSRTLKVKSLLTIYIMHPVKFTGGEEIPRSSVMDVTNNKKKSILRTKMKCPSSWDSFYLLRYFIFVIIYSE